MQKIVVPVDFSDGTEQIVEQAMQMAKAFSASIYLLHVEPPIKDSSGRDNGEPIAEMAKGYLDETGKLNALAKQVRNEDIETHAIFIEGVPSLSILEFVQKVSADVIVMGTHGHGVFTGILLGGVSQGIVKGAKCPVMLIPTIN